MKKPKTKENKQNKCNHRYSDGTSAINYDAFASPYEIGTCQICGKTFE